MSCLSFPGASSRDDYQGRAEFIVGDRCRAQIGRSSRVLCTDRPFLTSSAPPAFQDDRRKLVEHRLVERTSRFRTRSLQLFPSETLAAAGLGVKGGLAVFFFHRVRDAVRDSGSSRAQRCHRNQCGALNERSTLQRADEVATLVHQRGTIERFNAY